MSFLLSSVSKFVDAVPLASGVLGLKEEFDEPLAELFLGSVFVFEGSIAGATVWVFFSVGVAGGVLVTMSDGGFRVSDGAQTLQKHNVNSFLGIFARAATVPPLVFVSSSGAGKALSGLCSTGMGPAQSLDSWFHHGFQLSSSFVENAALLAVHRQAAVQEYMFPKWVAKGKSKEFGRYDFIQPFSRQGFFRLVLGSLWVSAATAPSLSRSWTGVTRISTSFSSRVRSGILEAPEKVQAWKSIIQFFVKGKVGALTSVCVSLEWADMMMCMSRWEGDGWISILRCLVVASPRTVPCSCTIDSVVGPVKMRLDSGRLRDAMRNVVGLCVHGATHVENFTWMLLHLGMARARGETKAHWAEILRRLPVMCRPVE